MSERATRDGRFGVRQFKKGAPTGGGTVGCGWATLETAIDANPPVGDYTYEVFDRFAEPVEWT